ncbi:MAG: hypothetical protein FWD02_05005 [Bacteroidales bacterium]|nr:hypothetical protein [Bacteroidales bacterium]
MKYKVTKNISLIAICLFLAFCGHSQRGSQRQAQVIAPTFDFETAEAQLAELFAVVTRGEAESIRYNANIRFLELLKNTLVEEGAFDHPFANLGTQILQPPDRKFRMFNWIVRRDLGMEFFAVMMVRVEHAEEIRIIQLIDESETIFDRSNAILEANNWYGAHYRQVIQTEGNDGRRYYTLLGWNGNDPAVSRSIIEVMTFRPNGDPVFGAAIFTDERGRRERFVRKVFEYARRSSMILRYDLQAYREPAPTRRHPQRHQYVETNMIVFDHLVPQCRSGTRTSDMRGRREAYIPSGGVHHAYIWLDNRWTLKPDIRARMPAPEGQRRRR